MTNIRCLRSICPGRKKIPEKEEDPRKDPSTQMCSRSRQKSILPDTRCPRIPRRMKKIQEQISPENLQQRSPVIRRRLSADKCRGIPMWIGQSSQVIPRPFCPRCGQTDILQGSGCGEDHGFPPGVRITHPRGLSVVSSPQLLRDEDLFRGRFPSGGNEERKTDNSDSSLTNHCVCAESPNKIYGTPGRRVMPVQVEEKLLL